MRVGGQRHAPAALPPGKIWYPLYRRLGGLDRCRIFATTGIRSPDRPTRNDSLYRLSYLCPHYLVCTIKMFDVAVLAWDNSSNDKVNEVGEQDTYQK
jgi:hypothetical protein